MLEMLQDNAAVVIGIICLCISACLLVASFAILKRTKRRGMTGDTRTTASSTLIASTPFCAYLALKPSERRVVEVAGAFEKITGLRPDQIISNAYALDYCLDDDARHTLENAFDAWDGNDILALEFPLVNDATGESVYCQLQAYADHARGLWFVELRDISQVHTEIVDLAHAALAAEESEKAKLRFLSDMSHEIRTPMNGIMGTLALAKIHHEDPAQVDGYLTQIDDLTQYLLSIINNVLDISKIENGKMELEERCFSLDDVLETMRALFGESTKTKGIIYTVAGDDLPNPYVVGDELRLVQVITNLVSNAQKFTPAGGSIEVTLLHVQTATDRLHFAIRVSDTGKGMSKEFLKTIFDPFSQESASTSRQFGGTGLGMAISDQIISLMGGNIIVESELGEGTTFEIYLGLPIGTPEQIEEYEQEKRAQAGEAATDAGDQLFSIKGSKILLAEDNVLNAGIAEEMLLEMGAEYVDLAADGKTACDMFAQSAQGYYSIVLMDIQMPNMDGREAARTIRAMEHPDAADIPIIALSADAYVEDKRASRDAGMNGHISKPIVYETLEQQISNELAFTGVGGQ